MTKKEKENAEKYIIRQKELMEKDGFVVHVVTENLEIDNLVANIHTHGLMKTKQCPELLLLVYNDMYAADNITYTTDEKNIEAFTNVVYEVAHNIIDNEISWSNGIAKVKTSIDTFSVYTTIDRHNMMFKHHGVAIIPMTVNRILRKELFEEYGHLSPRENFDHYYLYYPN